MKAFIVALAIIATVSAKPQGWGPTPTPGWQSSTPGWQAPGWNAPSGWGAGIGGAINLDSALAAAGSGWAAENHADNVQAVGAGGWGPNAQITISSNGDSVVSQDGAILEVTSQDNQSAASLNNVGVAQQAAASESQVLDAAGLDVSNQQSGWAAAQGEGASAADATSSVDIPGADLGLPHRKH